MVKKILRLNKQCRCFPCHTRLQDCTFCYCPFYPCGDREKGSFVIGRGRRRVWSCQGCNWIHNRKVVDRIFALIRKYHKV